MHPQQADARAFTLRSASLITGRWLRKTLKRRSLALSLISTDSEMQCRPSFVAVAVTAMGINCAFADDASGSKLQGDTLEKAVSGKTVHLATPLGTLPIRFRMDGTMSGTAGELAAYTGTAEDSGRWWVNSEKLCQRWRTWLNGQTYRFTLRQEGRLVQLGPQ
jgi:hypothetical protein